MENTVTYMLGGTAIVLLALIPAFIIASRQAKTTQKKRELEAHNAEIDKQREQKKALKAAKRESPRA